jgi:hypothetical protein
MEVSGQLHAPAALLPGKEPLYPLDWRIGGPQSRSGSGGEEKNSQPAPGIEPQNSGRPARSPGAIPTELSRLYSYEEATSISSPFLRQRWKHVLWIWSLKHSSVQSLQMSDV